MGNAQKAAEDIRNIAQRFKGFLEAAEVLEKIGSLEQAVRDSEDRKKKAFQDAESAVNAKSVAEESLSEALKAVQVERDRAVEIGVEANRARAEIIEKARVEAEQIVEEGQRKKNAILQEVVGHKAGLEQLQKQIEEARAELQSLNRQVDEVRAKFAAFAK